MADMGTILVDGDGTSPRAWDSQSYADIDEGISSADGSYAYHAPLKDLSDDTSFTLAAVPSDLSNVDTLSYNLRYAQSGRSDDDLYLGVRIVNGATILAAADAGGSFEEVGPITNTSFSNSGATGFTYVNTGAAKSLWDDAIVELRARNVGTKAGDNAQIRCDTVEFTGTYTAAAGDTGTIMPALMRYAGGI